MTLPPTLVTEASFGVIAFLLPSMANLEEAIEAYFCNLTVLKDCFTYELRL